VCGNADLYFEVGGYAGTVYHCKECGYIGSFIIEANEEMIEKIRENYKRERQNESDDSNELSESNESNDFTNLIQ
jgi:hypothetical protein